MIDVFHKPCGTLIGRWVNEPPRTGVLLKCADFQRPDGTHPKPGDVIPVMCEKCQRMATTNEWDWEGRR